MSELLYIIDTFSLVFQVFHAIPAMTGAKSQPTNAVFGFTRDLQMILREKKPTHLICALDSKGPGVRNDLYSDYKSNRDEMPVDLRLQIPMILDVIEGLRIPAIAHAGWEADDVFATLACEASERGFEVRIVTGDKDARQLIGPRVKVYNVRKDELFAEAELMKKWGVRPDQVIDFQALVGDSVDNVPGVPLVGPKKAKTLLERFGTLEEVLAHADEAPGAKLRENLKNFAEQAYLSRRLVTLNTRLPLDVDWEAARVHEPNRGRLLKLFTDFGFRQFAEEMRQPGPDESTVEETQRTWEIIDTADKFSGFLETLKQQHKFCLKLETTSLNAMQAEIVGWAFSWQAGTGYYLPVEGPPGQTTLDRAAVLEALRPILENPDIQVINHNIKYDMIVLRRSNVQLAGVGVDPMVGDYLLDAGARTHKLDNLAARALNQRTTAFNELDDGDKTAMIEIDPGKAAEFAVADADVAWQVAEKITEELQRENLWDLYWNLERPLIPVLADMEFAGIRVDVDELSRQSEQVAGRLDQLIEQIYGLAGHEFNIDSPKQLSVVLFDELNLPVLKKIKTGASTNQNVLEKLAAMHPLPALITEHRQLSKLKGTYLDALPEQVNPETGNIHASFHQTVAATGRLSASDPNLQNIPIRTEEGRRVRKAFIPSQPGWKLVCSDYSQIELRMLAHFSDDSVLQAAFRQRADVHATVAAEIFDVDVEQVDSNMRRVAKAVNFGVIYGQTPFGLSATLDISRDDAATFIDHYFAKYARVDQYLEELLALCAQSGCATTILGRRRKITGIRANHRGQLNFPERTAINTVIQGSAADLIKQAMIRIRARLKREGHPARMLLQIHDELMFEAPADQTDSLIEIVREEMEHAMELSVPLVVDLSIGDNWLEIESA